MSIRVGLLGEPGGSNRAALPVDARCATCDEPLDLGEGRHRGVAGSRHRQRPVRDAVRQRRLDVELLEQAVDEPGGERVAAADAVENLEGLERRADEEPVASE